MIGAGVVVVSLVVGVPALVFVLWPLFGRDRRARTFLPLPPDRRQELSEDKRVALAAIRELEFEHAAGHVSDADFAELRARYEGEAAAILTELDRLGPGEPAPAGVAPAEPRRSAWRHPAALAAAAVLLVVFGIAVGAGIVRYTERDPMAGHGPMPANGGFADAERVGDLLMFESHEIAQLHHFRFQGIFPGQRIERLIHQQELVVLDRRGDPSFVPFHPFLIAAAFELGVAAGAVHEDPAHGLGGGGKEVRPVGKLERLRPSEPLVGFVNQRRRLQRMPVPFGRHFVRRDRPQFGINLIIELVQ